MAAKIITLTDPETSKQYKLEITLDDVINLEKQGISQATVAERPVTTIYAIFIASFNKHSQSVSTNIRKKLFDFYKGDKLTEKLTDMYLDAISALEGENEEGNALWEANW